MFLCRLCKHFTVKVLHDYETPRQARQNLTRYLAFYNEARLHKALDYRTPAQVYFGGS